MTSSEDAATQVHVSLDFAVPSNADSPAQVLRAARRYAVRFAFAAPITTIILFIHGPADGMPVIQFSGRRDDVARLLAAYNAQAGGPSNEEAHEGINDD